MKLTSSWLPARVDRGFRSALHGTTSAGPEVREVNSKKLALEQHSHTFGKSGAIALCFLVFSWMSQLKHLLLRVFLEDGLPEMLSKLSVLAKTSMNKSKKHHAIAPAALGGCGGLGQLWEALAELREGQNSSNSH